MTTLMSVAEVTNVPTDLGEEGSTRKEMNHLPHPPFGMGEKQSAYSKEPLHSFCAHEALCPPLGLRT